VKVVSGYSKLLFLKTVLNNIIIPIPERIEPKMDFLISVLFAIQFEYENTVSFSSLYLIFLF